MARCVLLAILLAGCSQSLFDGPGGSSSSIDGGIDGDGDGGATPGPDGSVAATCPAPCLASAGPDFDDMTQPADWHYRVDPQSGGGFEMPFLVNGTFQGVQTWTGNDTAVMKCADLTDSDCDGLEEAVIVFTNGAGSSPVIAYRAQTDDTLRISGWAVALGDPRTHRMRITRNSRYDAVSRVSVSTEGQQSFDVTLEVLAGDEVQIAFDSGTPASTEPIALVMHVSRVLGELAFPGACALALTFDDDVTPIPDRCGGATFENRNDGIGPAGLSVHGTAASELLGGARIFAEGQFLRSNGNSMPYANDFTVQFVARFDEPQPSFGTTPYGDWSNVAGGGVSTFLGQASGMDFCHQWGSGGDDEVDCFGSARPTDGNWHFYRISRSRDQGTLRACIDGAPVGSSTGGGSLDLTTDQPPHIGRNVDYTPAYFGGSIDEVRVFSRALPCE